MRAEKKPNQRSAPRCSAAELLAEIRRRHAGTPRAQLLLMVRVGVAL